MLSTASLYNADSCWYQTIGFFFVYLVLLPIISFFVSSTKLLDFFVRLVLKTEQDLQAFGTKLLDFFVYLVHSAHIDSFTVRTKPLDFFVCSVLHCGSVSYVLTAKPSQSIYFTKNTNPDSLYDSMAELHVLDHRNENLIKSSRPFPL